MNLITSRNCTIIFFLSLASVCSIQFSYTLKKNIFSFQANLIIQEAKLGVAQADLDAAQATLDEKQAELDEVQALYDAAMKEKQACYYF